MADKEEQESRSFIQEMMRRHVVSSTIAYVVGAWVLIQVVDVLAPAFDAPDWSVRALSTVLLVLYPLFLVLAWQYNLTRHGLERTTDDRDRGLSAKPWFRRSIVGLVSIASMAAIWFVWSTGMLTEPTIDTDDAFPRSVAVNSFAAFTSEESQWLGEGIANLIRDNLSQSKFVRMASGRRLNALAIDESEDPLEAALDAGIHYLLQGEIIGSRGGHVLTVRLTDTRTRKQLDARSFEVDADGSLLDRATAVAQYIRALLNVPVQERVDHYSADFAADNPSAYRAFVGALDYWVNFEFSEAERLFQAALTLQPDFAMARYYLAWNLAVQDRLTDALAQLEKVAGNRTLNERDAQYIEALSALLSRDASAGEKYRALVEEYPNDTEARQLLAEAYYQAYELELSLQQYEQLARLEPEVHYGWSGAAYTHMSLGNHELARPAIEKFREIAADNPNVYILRGDLNRAQGQLNDARRDYQLAIEKGPELQDAVVSLARTEYLLGDAEAALKTLDKLIRDEDAVPRYRMDAAFEAGGILNALGRYDDHIAYLDLLHDEFVASEILEAKALADKAMAMLFTGGPSDAARSMAENAIEASPGVATRYLFTRAMIEVAAEDFSAANLTAEKIRALALPPDDPDRTEDKAADYIRGLVAAAIGSTDQAAQYLAAAVDAEGYEYRRYGVAYARVLANNGDRNAALAILDSIAAALDPADPRLDLEKDRLEAIALAAKLGQSLNSTN